MALSPSAGLGDGPTILSICSECLSFPISKVRTVNFLLPKFCIVFLIN